MSTRITIKNQETGRTQEFPWGQISWLANHELTGDGCGLTLGVVTIGRGERNMEHLHPNCDELVYVERGRIEHTLGNEAATLEAGEMIHVPRGARHSARNIGDEDVRLIVVYDTARREIKATGCDGDPECTP